MTAQLPTQAQAEAPKPSRNLAGGAVLLAFSRVWAQVASGVLFFVTSLAITAAEFGEYVIATSLFSALAVGVGHGTYEYVIKARDSNRAAPTVFFLNILAAALVSLLALGAVAVVPRIVPSENIDNILALLIPAYFLIAVTALMESVVMKRGNIKQVAITSLMADTGSLLVALWALASGAGVYSLVYQRLTREVVIAVLYGLRGGWRPALIFDLAEARMALNFARSIVSVRILQMGSTAIIDLTIGGVLGTSEAGLFRLVSRLLTIGSDVIAQPFRAAIWVRLPPLHNDLPAFRRAAFELLEMFGVALFAVLAGITLISQPLLQLLGKPEWGTAAPLVAIVAFGKLVRVASSLSEVVFSLRDRMSLLTWTTLASSAVFVAVTWILAPYGLLALALGATVASVLIQAVVTPLLARCLDISSAPFLGLMARLSLNALTMSAVALPLLALEQGGGAPEWFQVASIVLVGGVTYVTAARVFTPLAYNAFEGNIAHLFDKRWRRGRPAS